MRVDQRLDRDDGCRQSALHVAGAAAVHLAVLDDGGERIHGPAGAGLHDIDVAVEMHAGSSARALAARDDIDARIARIVAGRAAACTYST
jgi:hypothetical protein